MFKRNLPLLLLFALIACSKPWELTNGYQLGHFYVTDVTVTEKETGKISNFASIAPEIHKDVSEMLSLPSKDQPKVTLTIELTAVDITRTSTPSISSNLILRDGNTHQIIGSETLGYVVPHHLTTPDATNPITFISAPIADVIIDKFIRPDIEESQAIHDFSYEVFETLYPQLKNM